MQDKRRAAERREPVAGRENEARWDRGVERRHRKERLPCDPVLESVSLPQWKLAL